MEMTYEEWLQTGVEEGYCSRPVCDTHDGLPRTAEEEDEWDEGGDPCLPAVRLYPDGKPEGIQE